MAIRSLPAFLSMTLLLAVVAPVTLFADPGPLSAESGHASPPSAQQPTPPAPPSRIDPGIQKTPDTVPNPKSIVPPPVLDPKMAIDPERPDGGPTHPKPPSTPDKPAKPPR